MTEISCAWPLSYVKAEVIEWQGQNDDKKKTEVHGLYLTRDCVIITMNEIPQAAGNSLRRFTTTSFALNLITSFQQNTMQMIITPTHKPAEE